MSLVDDQKKCPECHAPVYTLLTPTQGVLEGCTRIGCNWQKWETIDAIGSSPKNGTKVTFKPDTEIFTMTDFSFEVLNNRLREISFLNAGLEVTLEDSAKMDVAAEQIAKTSMALHTAPPYRVTLEYDASKLDRRGRYGVRARIENDGRLTFRSPGTGSLHDVLIEVYGLDIAESMIEIGVDEVNFALAQENVNASGGRLRDRNAEYIVRTLSRFQSLEDIAQVTVANVDGRQIRLEDVATVSRTHRERTILYSTVLGQVSEGMRR